ncbi:hypothetical protein L0337_14100 [candidate division KSB1 bacterium]|nr:hypothetical protein [candidate division KSB1 bacterium]
MLHRIVGRRAQNGKQNGRQEKRLQPRLEKKDSNQKSSSSLPTALTLKSYGRAGAPA